MQTMPFRDKILSKHKELCWAPKEEAIDRHASAIVNVSDACSPALTRIFPQKLNHNSKRAMSITAAIS